MDRSTASSAAEYDNSATATAIYKAIGFELRMVREDHGWSRAKFVKRLPSRVTDRTLASYEDGERKLTLLRFLELCQALGVSASQTLTRACQRARLDLETLVLEIDLEALLAEKISPSPILQRWARNKLDRQPNAPAMMTPAAVVELADVIGSPPPELAHYLAKFIPQQRAAAENLSDHVLGDVESKLVRTTT